MNVGQVLETHLGLVAQSLGWKVATPVFDGATAEDIQKLLVENNFPANGKIQLYDGRTGYPFDNPATVGYKYMLKLDHMVDSKMHARSIGPYSLVTQQPLGERQCSEVRDLVRWKFGLLRLMVHQMSFKKF